MHVDSTGKNIAYLSKPCLSNEWSGNSGGQRVYAWNVKMARNYPSPLENCLQLKTKLLMFILTIGHFFNDNIYSIVKRYYWKKKCEKKIDSNVTRTWLGLELDSCYDQTLHMAKNKERNGTCWPNNKAKFALVKGFKESALQPSNHGQPKLHANSIINCFQILLLTGGLETFRSKSRFLN